MVQESEYIKAKQVVADYESQFNVAVIDGSPVRDKDKYCSCTVKWVECGLVSQVIALSV